MTLQEAIMLIKNSILDSEERHSDETCTCADFVNIEALELLLKEVEDIDTKR